MKPRIATSIATLAAIAAASAVQAQTALPAAQPGTRLELQARGEVRVTPDIAVVSAGVVTQSADASTAMRENAARMTRVFAALKQAGIAEISEAVTHLEGITQQNAAMVEELAAASKTLTSQVNQVHNTMQVFRLASNDTTLAEIDAVALRRAHKPEADGSEG